MFESLCGKNPNKSINFLVVQGDTLTRLVCSKYLIMALHLSRTIQGCSILVRPVGAYARFLMCHLYLSCEKHARVEPGENTAEVCLYPTCRRSSKEVNVI
ncbi:uncharacterized protein [Montipora capricornis]|uniref:uncharacterized protein isoform X2 n=1 Tax=Montipora capricornis TaxID=246305 RepID=UPI0035F1F063